MRENVFYKFIFIFPVLITIGLFTLLIGITASGQELTLTKKTKKKKAISNFEISAQIKGTYDDNILQYSNSDIQAFLHNEQRSRFAIETCDDFIISPSIEISYYFFRKSGFATRFILGIKSNTYWENRIKNYQNIYLKLSQKLYEKNFIRLSYSYIPEFYLRHLWNDDMKSPYLHYSKYQAAKFERHFAGFEVERNLLRQFSMTAGASWEIKDYNPSFNARDIHGNTVSIEGEYKFNKVVSSRLTFVREWASAKGYDSDDDGQTYNMYDDPDVSYTSDIPEVSLILNLMKLKGCIPVDMRLTYQREDKKYTTAKTDDTDHYARKDKEQSISAYLARRLTSFLELTVEYKYQFRTSNLADQGAGIGESIDYQNNRCSLGLEYKFENSGKKKRADS